MRRSNGEVQSNTEGVGQLQPRVELWQPWGKRWAGAFGRNPEGVARPSLRFVSGGVTLSGFSLTKKRHGPRVVKARAWAEICEHHRCKANLLCTC